MVAEMILIPRSAREAEPAKQCAQYVARALSTIGVKVREQISLCSGKVELQKAIASALGRSNVVVLLGGLSKEQGYLSRQVVTQGLHMPLEQNEECLAAIKRSCAKLGEPFTPQDAEMANVPKDAVVFPAQYGKVPGFAISSAKQHIILMPDSLTEAAAMLPSYIVPYLSGNETKTAVNHTVRACGVNAEQVRASLCELLDTENPAVTLEKEGGEVLVRVSAHASTSQEASALCTPVLREVADRLGDVAYGLDVDSLQEALVQKLRRKCLDIAVAQSDCDGIVARVLFETPGGNEILRHSAVCEDDNAKIQMGVSPKLLKKKGSVSEAAAIAMAAAVREKASADLGLAVTACASEGKKSEESPLGLVYIAVCDVNNVYVKKLVVGTGDPRERDGIIDTALSRALNMARLFVDYLPGVYPGAIPLRDALEGRTVTDKESYGAIDGSAGRKEKVEKGFFRRLLDNFFIRKADEPRDKVRKFIFILAILVFLGSAGYVGKYYYDSRVAQQQKDQLAQLYFGDEDVEISDDFPDNYLYQFAALWSINPDVAGYLSIDDTIVQYPVVQSDDNSYYLRRDFYENANQWGIPYLDYRVRDVREPETPSDNIVIYGHNMKDGQMFGEVVNYQQLEYYKEHPVIDFSTVYEERQYKVFAVFITNAYEAQGTPLFDYHNYIDMNEELFMEYVEAVRIRSLFNTTVDVEAGDKLLTLSTCTYEFTEARMVVMARQVRPGEDLDVDVENAEKNPTPLYPDIWYTLYKGTKPAVTASAFPTAQTVPSTVSSNSSSAPAVSASSTPPPQQPSSSSQTSEPESQSESESSSEEASESAQPSNSDPSRESSESSREPTLFDHLQIPSENTQNTQEDLEIEGVSLRYASKIAIRAVSTDREPSLFDRLEIDPPRGKMYSDDDDTGSARDSAPDTVTVSSGGSIITGDAQDIVARAVQREMGSSFDEEALKAQAVAVYSYILYYNNKGQTPSISLCAQSEVHNNVKSAVAKVAGEAVYYDDKVAFTPYHATSAGQTTTAASVWGGSIPYLVSVDSAVDKSVTNYRMKRTYSSDTVSDILYEKLGIETQGDPEDWFEILSYNDGGYVGKVSVCGETKSAKNGATITGRSLRETVFGLRSACFTIVYDSESDTFTVTTSGYGHGVGMSQNGANQYARQGWSYVEILEHYYSGTTVR